MESNFGMNCFSHLMEYDPETGMGEKRLNPAEEAEAIAAEQEAQRIAIDTGEDGGIFALREYDPADMPISGICTTYGTTGTGKSVIFTDFLERRKDKYGSAVVLSATESAKPHYSKIINPMFIYPTLDADVIAGFIKRQVALTPIEHTGYRPPTHLANGDPIIKEGILIIDDMQSDKKAWHHSCIKTLAFEARHFGLFVGMCLQHIGQTPNYVRESAHTVIFVAESNPLTMKKIHLEFFAALIPKLRDFMAVMKQYTANYGCLVLKMKHFKSPDLKDRLFWFKARGLSLEWKFGSKAFRDFSANFAKDVSDMAAPMDWNRNFAVGGGVAAAPVDTAKPKGRKGKAQESQLKFAMLSKDGKRVVK